MPDNFGYAIGYVLQNEGGFVDNPKDPGGATNFGITLRTLQQWRGVPCTPDDVKNLTPLEARLIYRKLFWDYLLLGQLTSEDIATAIMDTAVNRGKVTAVKYVQDVCGLTLDGGMGPVTLRAIEKMTPNDFITSYAARIKQGYEDLLARCPNLACFKAGWMARADRLLTLQTA